jgi:predicted DNA-binding transcriptional regulator YafY
MPTALFSSEAVQALLLGSRWRAESGEGPLAAAAREALAKCLPPPSRTTVLIMKSVTQEKNGCEATQDHRF